MTTSLVKLAGTSALFAGLLLCLPSTSESGGGKAKSKDKTGNTPTEKPYVQGEDHLKDKARWNWTLLDNGKEADKGTFMGYVDGKIKHGTTQEDVGTWKSTAKGTVSVNFTWPRLKGAWEFKMVKAEPPTYDGKMKGAAKKLVLEIRND